MLDLGDGTSAYRNVNAIENEPGCQRCHSAAEGLVLGVLISDLDLEPVRSALAANRRSSVLWSAGSLLLISFIVNLMMGRLVLSPVGHFMAAIRLIAKGNLGARVSIQNRDEYAMLAASFNQMIEGIGEKQTLEDSLHAQAQELRAQTERLSTLNALTRMILTTVAVLGEVRYTIPQWNKTHLGGHQHSNRQRGRHVRGYYERKGASGRGWHNYAPDAH